MIQLKDQTIFLKDNNIKINSQLDFYKNKELESKSIIENLKKVEKELREKNKYLEETISNLKLNTNDNNHDVNELQNKIKYYQQENVRIGSELFESNKKLVITKTSLNELQNHRSGLIEKINSINEVIKNENIVTSVFDSDLEQDTIKVIDASKSTNKDTKDTNNLDEKIKNIFDNK